MPVGIDTGFFYALKQAHPVAIQVWQEKEIVTCALVLYELQKKLLKGEFKHWPAFIESLKEAVTIVEINTDIALKAAHLAHGLGMPGIDALILAALLEAGCKEIYTTDGHFELYKKKGVEIINLNKCFRGTA